MRIADMRQYKHLAVTLKPDTRIDRTLFENDWKDSSESSLEELLYLIKRRVAEVHGGPVPDRRYVEKELRGYFQKAMGTSNTGAATSSSG